MKKDRQAGAKPFLSLRQRIPQYGTAGRMHAIRQGRQGCPRYGTAGRDEQISEFRIPIFDLNGGGAVDKAKPFWSLRQRTPQYDKAGKMPAPQPELFCPHHSVKISPPPSFCRNVEINHDRAQGPQRHNPLLFCVLCVLSRQNKKHVIVILNYRINILRKRRSWERQK